MLEIEQRKLRTVELVYVGMFAALMMVGANITSFVPFLVIGGVPITLQSFFAILAGTLLGSRLGALAMTVYAFVGLIGAPVFARFSGGIGALVSPTFGFILSFIAVAYVTGKLIEKNKQLHTYIVASFFGLTINYLIGTHWFYFALKWLGNAPEGFTYKMAWWMMVPPLLKDLFLTAIAGWIAYRVGKTVKITRD